MTAPAGGTAIAGVTLSATAGRAVLLGAVLHDLGTVTGPEDLVPRLLAACRASGDRLAALTIDLSRRQLAEVLAHGPEIPRVAVIRVVPRAATDPVLARSPAPQIERMVSLRWTVAGGHDLLGNELRGLDTDGLARVCAEMSAAGVDHVAIVAAGSQGRPQHERAVAEAVQAALPGAQISVASDFGGHGLVAREATVILDVALRTLTDRMLLPWEAALDGLPVTLRIARGDGGYSTPARMRALPVVAFGAAPALALAGAAFRYRETDCRVVLIGPDGPVAGDIRHGFPVVRSSEPAGIGTELAVPTAPLSAGPADTGPDRGGAGDVPVVRPSEEAELLVALGAAVSRPTSWLDEVTFIGTSDGLEVARREVQERAVAMVMANGALPGTATLIEFSAVAVPYSPAGTVRLRVRAAGEDDLGVPTTDLLERSA